jgi:hypothetical protein
MIKKNIPLHPFLLALFPVISLWSTNADYVSPEMVIRSLVLTMTLAASLLLLVHLATREWLKASVITSLILLVVLTYGHFYTVLKDVQMLNPIIRHRYLLPVIGVLLGFVIILVLKNGKIVPSVSLFLTVMSIVLVTIPLTQLILFQINTNSSKFKFPQMNVEASSGVQAHTPDIYYIILDAYGREDTLKDFYIYDNSEFIHALEQRGFYVADKSNSNYMQTLLSLSSSLNMDYLDKYISQNDGNPSVHFLSGLIDNSRLREFLSSRGYKMVAYETTFEDLSKADLFLKPPEEKNLSARSLLSINEFEGMLIDTTIGKAWLDTFYKEQNSSANSILRLPYLQHHNRVIFTLTDLANVAKMPGNKFVFAHVISPHPPFVFDRNGNFVYPPRAYSTSDGNYFNGGREEYISGYTEEIQYLNKLVLKAVDEIMANSSEPPIIIIQGDHGPGAYTVFDSVEQSNVQDRMAMLNAYYFPDRQYVKLYPSISPVNSFRVVLDEYFGAALDLLPDNHYFSTETVSPLDGSRKIIFRNINDYLNK